MFKQRRPYWCGPAALVALQIELGRGPALTQAEWADLAGTTRNGTGPAGLKKALALLSDFEISRKRSRPFRLAIVFDRFRDHWIVARCAFGAVLVLDPLDGSVTCELWHWFRELHLNSARESYALVVE